MKRLIMFSFIMTIVFLIFSVALLIYNLLHFRMSEFNPYFNLTRILLFLFVVLMFLVTRFILYGVRYIKTKLSSILGLAIIIPVFSLFITILGELLTIKTGDGREFILFFVLQIYYVVRFLPGLLKFKEGEA